MADSHTIRSTARYCLQPIADGTLERSGPALDLSTFEIRMEIYFILFLSAHLDGRSSHSETTFLQAVCDQLGWSQTDRSLVASRIDHLPAYSLDIVKHLPQSRPPQYW